jgi:hypothetical protein
MMLTKVQHDDDDDIFWQKLILPEEDRRRSFPDMTWTGGYRWFRSENVVCIEHFRRPYIRGQAGSSSWLGAYNILPWPRTTGCLQPDGE